LQRLAFHRIFPAMLTLLLLRHAKSSWDDLSLEDFDRPLNKRGSKAAPLIGAHLVKQALIPDLVLCSTSVRTRATLTLVMNEFREATPGVIYDEALYLADAHTILEKIRGIKNFPAVVMVVGHNPGLHAIALELIRNGPREPLRTLAMQFPTAALAHITFEAERWSRIAPATGELVDFVLPRKLS
jgi:phosphohistidine phosphatase